MGLTQSSPDAMLDSVLVSNAHWDVDCAVVWLRGEHDLSTVPALSAILSRAIAHDGADLTLDLSEVLFMDAATVGVIVRTREFLRQRSRSLSLRSPSRCARRLLELCDLANLIEPAPAEATGKQASAAALGTWVAVPAIDRSDQLPDVSSPKPTDVPEPALGVPDPSKQSVS